MTGFNWIDALLILIILLSCWGGWQRGFILSFLDLARWLLSLVASLFFYRIVGRWIVSLTGWTEVWSAPLAFISIFVLVSLLIAYLGNRLLRRVPRDVHERRVNRVFGLLPGLANGLITAAILSALLFSMPFSDALTGSARNIFWSIVSRFIQTNWKPR